MDTMDRYQVTLTGKTPLLMHADNREFQDSLKAWRAVPAHKKLGVAGDDRSPAWGWVGCVYHDEGLVVIPSDNLMTTIREGGAMVAVPGGRSGKTFKAQSQSGIQCQGMGWPLLVNGESIDWEPIEALATGEEEDFKAHQETAKDLGFSLFVKPARVGQSKHVRVRPLFAGWSCSGELVVIDKQITAEVLKDILDCAGQYKGLCDWRPGSRTPGQYGTFTAEIKLVGHR